MEQQRLAQKDKALQDQNERENAILKEEWLKIKLEKEQVRVSGSGQKVMFQQGIEIKSQAQLKNIICFLLGLLVAMVLSQTTQHF